MAEQPASQYPQPPRSSDNENDLTETVIGQEMPTPPAGAGADAPAPQSDLAATIAARDASDLPSDEPQPVMPIPALSAAPAPGPGLLQQPWVQDLLPLMTSIALHVGVFLFAWGTYEGYQAYRQVVEEQIIVPDAAIVEAADIGGLPNPGLGDDPTRAAAQDEFPDAAADASSENWATTPSQTLTTALLGGGGGDAQEAPDDSLIGMGAGGLLTRGPGSGTGTGTGTGDSSGALAPFGVPGGGGGLAPRTDFMGVSGNARRVVYVCDATGTMLGLKYKLLQRELYSALDVLKPIQGFNVIFFKGGDSDRDWANPFSQQLMLANSANTQRATEFIADFQVIGKGTNPLPALRIAFQQRPDLIYFLSDGQFDNVVRYEEVLAEVRRLNADKSVRINTIAFMSEDMEAEQALQTMAKENGGRFVKITAQDLRN